MQTKSSISNDINFYKETFAHSGIGMGVCDLSGQCIEVNEAMCRLTGGTREEILKQNFNNLDSWKKSGLLDATLDVIRKNKEKHHEVTLTSSFNRTVTIDYHIIPFTADDQRYLLFIFNDITAKKRAEDEKDILINKLQSALAEIKILQEILPICSYCKKIRNDEGYWEQVENYVSKHFDADFSHSICPDCMEDNYPDVYKSLVKKGKIKK